MLSVVSTQFKSILDAIREGRDTFQFPGEEVALDHTVGAFITMNPGYLGRTELPESLKALFRPVTVSSATIIVYPLHQSLILSFRLGRRA